MIRLSPVVAVLCIAVLTACDTAGHPLLEPDATLHRIQDARDIDSGVYLVPPINDNEFTRTGPFDIEADPRVEICRLDVDALTEESIEAAPCLNEATGDPPEYWFETDAAHDDETFVIVTPTPGETATDSMFSVSWKTNAADANQAFRGTILVPSLIVDGLDISVEYREAARFDVVLYDNSSTKLDPARIVGFTAGKNFPVKFIVEESAGCDGLDCFAYKVTCQADLYETDHAGVLMPEDWATECDENDPGPERNWWLFQERRDSGTVCLPDGLYDGIAYGSCYVWQLVEEVDTLGDASAFVAYTDTFAAPVTVQFCDDYIPSELVPLANVFRYSNPPGEVVALEPGEEDILSNPQPCPYDGPLVSSSGSIQLGALSTDVFGPVMRLLGLAPQPLYAGDTGVLSASTVRMSDFQRAIEMVLEGTTALSTALVLGNSQELGVRLATPPHHEGGSTVGVPGIEVQFAIIEGGELADLSADTFTSCGEDCIRVLTSNLEGFENDGFASATLSIPTTATSGTVVIEVTVPADGDFTAIRFSVEAVDLLVSFLEPLETGDFPGDPEPGFQPTVLICAEALVPCTSANAEAEIETADIKLVDDNGRKFYQADWKPRDTGTAEGGTYVAQIQTEGATVGTSIPIVVTKGGKSERIDDVYYNGVNSSVPLKFTITRIQ